MTSAPGALLLDFGGVIADSSSAESTTTALVSRLHQVVAGAVPPERIAADLARGARAHASWRDEVSRQQRPGELTHTQVWDDFVTSDWPVPARDAVRGEATALAYAWARRPTWVLRPGMSAVLSVASAAGLPVAVVSNTTCGAAHRDFLAAVGVGDQFAAQFYSDEAGVRKPNPQLIWLAAERLGVPVAHCWFVGDSLTRDVEGARRAGAGTVVLMRSSRTGRERATTATAPDVVVDDGHGLRTLLVRALGSA
ncbi:MAG: HAD family hydrolase [Dactylosporangium sp.]|nr:HAD family hydrolase [Dactylosporangium sp.]NNJ62450.1 HAD family hydrolase [Dactylosporangium sp.]